MALRHAGACRVCGVALPAKTTAVYDFTAKNVICLGCRGEDATAHQQPPTGSVEPAAAAEKRRIADRRAGERRRSTDSN